MLYVLRMLKMILYRHECYFSVTEALELHFRKEQQQKIRIAKNQMLSYALFVHNEPLAPLHGSTFVASRPLGFSQPTSVCS